MQKFSIFLVFITLLIAACSQTSSPWDRPNTSRPAQQAPSTLTGSLTGQERFGETTGSQMGQTSRNFDVSKYTHMGLENRDQARLTQPQAPSQHENFSFESNSQNYYDQRATAAYPEQQPPPYGEQAPAGPTVKIGLLLPLSGPHAKIGQAMMNAAQLALFDLGYNSFELVPRDTKGTPDGASQAAHALAQENVQLILGPLFAGSVKSAKYALRGSNIHMVAFSTDWKLAGGNTFIMGFLPFAQVTRVMQYATQQGIRDMAALYPDSEYGNAVISIYRRQARQVGINVADVVSFTPMNRNISPIVREFAQYDDRVLMLEQYREELEARMNDPDASIPPSEAAGIKKELEELVTQDTFGEPPFDSVLLPVGGEQARSISTLLRYYDLENEDVRIIGTGLFDDTTLAGEGALDGAWFAAPSPNTRQSFEKRYKESFGETAPRLTSLAYDAMALAVVLARKGIERTGTPSFGRSDLTDPNGFAGIDGIFRFRYDGLVERGLAVHEIKNGKITVIDPAPTTFQQQYYN